MRAFPLPKTRHIPCNSASPEKERVSRLLEEVGKRDGIEGLRLGHDDTAALDLTSGKKVYFEYHESAALLVLYMPLLDLPRDPKRRLACLEQMLERNFLKLKTGQGELSLMCESDQAVYQIALHVTALDVDRLDRSIDEILEQYDTCRSALEKTISGTVPRPSLSSQDGGRQHLLASLRRR
jgi:hypothetical protein